MPTVSADQFRTLSTTLLKAAGARDDDARVATDAILFASLRGHDSHGVGHLGLYVRSYLNGTVNRDPNIRVVNETPATVAIDADWCLGQKVTLDATNMVIEKAHRVGIAAATITRATHAGALSFYATKLVEHDLIGIICSCSGAASPPFGGIGRLLGTNPLTIAIPAQDEYPIVVDMATSATTWLGLRAMLLSGDPLPPGLILDDEGELTTDPTKISGLPRAPEIHGSIASIGDSPKGYALQLAVEVLGGLLPGLISGNETSKEGKFNNPSLIIGIDVSAFQDLAAFKAKVDSRVREIRAARKKRGVDAIYVPGERGLRTQERRLEEGLPIHDEYWAEITKLGDDLKIDTAAFLSTSVV